MQDDKERRREYLDERKLLIDLEAEASHSFDKAMMTLSGGALGFSLAFMRDFTGHAKDSESLRWAWVALALCLMTTVWSFRLSQLSLRKQCGFLDAKERSRMKDPPKETPDARNRWTTATEVLNWLSAGLFTVGIVALGWFVYVNPKENPMNPNGEQTRKVVRELDERGFVAPRPPVDVPGVDEQPPPDTGNDAAGSEDNSPQANGDE